MLSTNKVIWVAQWYPHEGEPYAGDFIQRHARAVALYHPIHLFACFPASKNHQYTFTKDNLTETIIYFKPIETGHQNLDKILLWRKWKSLLQSSIRKHVQQYGKPNLIHCHITLNAGWLGLWAKKKWGIPYLITEHWSGYMTGATDGFIKYNRFSKRLFHHIIRQSLVVTTVSNALALEIQNIDNQLNWKRIPNVVDEAVFFNSIDTKDSRFQRLLHISTFSAQKNIPAMLTAFDKIATDHPNVEFHIVGPEKKFRKLFPQQANDSHYILHGEISQPAIAALMRQCNACVLYSHYETFGCVIIEANAAGLPVIVSDIPVLREIVQPGKNGILVQPDNPEALANAIFSLLNDRYGFDARTISQSTIGEFSFPVVGKQFVSLYSALLRNDKT